MYLATQPSQFLFGVEWLAGFNSLAWDLLPIQEIDYVEYYDPSLYDLWKEEESAYDRVSETWKEVDLSRGIILAEREGYFMVNPTIPPGGEWVAFDYAPWHPETHWYSSFEALIKAQYDSFKLLLAND